MRFVGSYWIAAALVVGVIASAAAWGQPEAKVIHRPCAANPRPDVVNIGDRVYHAYQLSGAPSDWQTRLTPEVTADHVVGHTDCPTQVVVLHPFEGIALNIALAPDANPNVAYVSSGAALDRALGLESPPTG